MSEPNGGVPPEPTYALSVVELHGEAATQGELLHESGHLNARQLTNNLAGVAVRVVELVEGTDDRQLEINIVREGVMRL